MNRKRFMASIFFRLMEIDPHYCDVIIDRYIAFTGSDRDVLLMRGDNKIPYKKATVLEKKIEK